MAAPSSPLLLSPEAIGTGIPAILSIAQAHFAAKCLYTVVQLGVPNIVGSQKLGVPDIVAKLPEGTRQEELLRILRFLTLRGIFEESAGPDGASLFGLTNAGALLQTGIQQPSMACGVLHWMEPPAWNAWGAVPDFVAGKTSAADPYQCATGSSMFDYYREHPASAAPFNDFMTFFSAGELPVLLEHVGWEAMAGKTVVDVGGSLGGVMGAVAEKFPEVKCISFDLPEVIEKAVAHPNRPKGVEFVKGDMFDHTTVPKGDVIFMKHILHDWSDEASVKILRAVSHNLGTAGEILVCDAVLPDAGAITNDNAPEMHLDTFMLVIGGKERTRRQWEALATEAGLRVKEVRMLPHPTARLVVMVKAS